MKKISLSVLILFSLSFGLVQAQETTPTKTTRNVFKLAPQQFAVNTFQLGFEHFNEAMNRSMSYNLGFTVEQASNDYSKNGVSGEYQYRFYFSKFTDKISRRSPVKYKEGAYLGPFAKLGWYNVSAVIYQYYPSGASTTKNEVYNVFAVNPGFTIGYQRTIAEMLVIDIYAGGGVRTVDRNFSNNYGYSIIDVEFKGIMPKFGMNVGIAF